MASPVLSISINKTSLQSSQSPKLPKPLSTASISLNSLKASLPNSKTQSPYPINNARLPSYDGLDNSVTQGTNKKLTAFRSWQNRQKRAENMIGMTCKKFGKACQENITLTFMLILQGFKEVLTFIFIVLRDIVIFPASILVFIFDKITELTKYKQKTDSSFRWRNIWSKKMDRDIGYEPFSPISRPPLTLWNKKPLTLVLDLDETIIHATKVKPTSGSFDTLTIVKNDGTFSEIYLRKRPYLNEFLQKIGREFNVVIYTASRMEYADTVMDFIDRYLVVSRRFYRESCTRGLDGWVKDLRKVELDLNRVVLLDNSKVCGSLQPENHLLINSWYDDEKDESLLHYTDFLLECVKKWKSDTSIIRDIRKFLKEFPFTHNDKKASSS